MNTWAAVMTGKGTGAIATIQVVGDQAGQILQRVFRSAAPQSLSLTPGKIALGKIWDENQTLDQVVIGCEGKELYAIHCHGNPLIVEAIMALLERSGISLLAPEALLAKALSSEGADTLQIEARIAQARARTLDGIRLIANQVTVGLRPLLARWPERTIPDIQTQAKKILADSEPGRLMIEGCLTAIVGPPNSGKSTLFNWLAGQDRSLVSDVRGTTRDWVQAECRLGPLCLDLIDTAGLDPGLMSSDNTPIEEASQERTLHMADRADLLLLVLDNSQSAEQLDLVPLDRISARPMLTVLNKSDLPTCFGPSPWPTSLGQVVQVSAKHQIGREALAQALCRVCGVTGLSLEIPVAFTPRQRRLIEQIVATDEPTEMPRLVTELLHGPCETSPPTTPPGPDASRSYLP
jgi:tRNA modification GTPase